MDNEYRYDSTLLRKLLDRWDDYPSWLRSDLTNKVAHLDSLAKSSERYETSLYPRWFFEASCSACLRVLEKGAAFEEKPPQMFLTAWNALQLSISIDERSVLLPD